MKINGTLVNYYFHCKRQCYLFGNRMNLEDNSEEVKIGRAIHEERNNQVNTEIAIDNIRIDKLTNDYLIEVKKSDADTEAAKWQLIFYLNVLKEKGVFKKGKLEFTEKNKTDKKILTIELDEKLEVELKEYIKNIEELLNGEVIPPVINKPGCKKCAYYEYCYI